MKSYDPHAKVEPEDRVFRSRIPIDAHSAHFFPAYGTLPVNLNRTRNYGSIVGATPRLKNRQKVPRAEIAVSTLPTLGVRPARYSYADGIRIKHYAPTLSRARFLNLPIKAVMRSAALSVISAHPASSSVSVSILSACIRSCICLDVSAFEIVARRTR